MNTLAERLPVFMRRMDPAVVTAFACILLLLFLGSLYSSNFLSPEYLLQQLKVASFLGIIATGMMLVILLGQIDLSLPWVVSVGAMMSSAVAGLGDVGAAVAIPFGIFCGVLIGLVNGLGVAYLRIPSMIMTLATNAVAQGLMVVYTGGFSPQDSASPAARYLATGFIIPTVPNSLATDHLNEVRSTAQEALQEMRLLLFELRPPVLEEEGLITALQIRLEAVERRSGLVTELKVEGDEELSLPAKVEDGLYRIAQEALNNALKHAQAQCIIVCLNLDPHNVMLEIADDGRGFDLATIREHAGLGLRGMEERAVQLGACLTI